MVGFLVTFAVTRLITHRIRARGGDRDEGSGLIGDIHIGGIHIHHVVWGILAVLLAGLLVLAYQPESPWLEVLGAAFGAGAALTLDEFALWLHLEDVYWTEQGRKSVDAVVFGMTLAILLLVGSSPFGVADSVRKDGLAIFALAVAVNALFALVTLAKGKMLVGMVGIFVPAVGLAGALRLARPDSPWARWRYMTRPERMARARERFAVPSRWDGIKDAIAGVSGSRTSGR